jgi:hypothetical protein
VAAATAAPAGTTALPGMAAEMWGEDLEKRVAGYWLMGSLPLARGLGVVKERYRRMACCSSRYKFNPNLNER